MWNSGGISLYESGMCVETAAGVGGAIVPTIHKIAYRPSVSTVPLADAW